MTRGKLDQFLKDENGQTTVEYLLIIAVIVVVIAVLGKGMQAQMKTLVENVFSGVNKKVKDLMSSAGG
jgi:Flp pilus assembly pilin Flp